MNLGFGSPALGLLLALKLRGALRRQWRRMRTPKGFVLTLIGTAAFVIWIGYLSFWSHARAEPPLTPMAAELRTRAFAGMLVVFSLSNALSNRGLFLPKAEIERLFSAPVSRADLVRYRLLSNGLRSLLGGLVLGLYGARRMPGPVWAFLGILLAMQTLPVVNQFVAIVLAGLGPKTAQRLKRAGSFLLTAFLLLLAAVAYALVSRRPMAELPLVGAWLAPSFAPDADPFAHPLLELVTWPLAPWARMIRAETLGAFLPWFLGCLAVHVLLVELCARVPIDFRELSLATSVRAAARVARLRRGGGVAATRASTSAALWRIPWFFGRGPLGAIAWRKSAGMARKAKGAFWVALVALLFITILVSVMLDGAEEGPALLAPALIGVLGTVYLCSGLRFDFREELERMDVIRSWPLAPARVFLATILPEVVLVAVLVAGTVLLAGALSQGLTTQVVLVALCVPFAVFTWVGLDNLVFLVAPVRFVPGQDGFVQNAGRRMIQMALLTALAVVFGSAGGAGFVGAGWVAGALGAPESVALVASFIGLALLLGAGDALLVRLGGFALRRFDVARDRG
ncbi:MAG: hypothetical protein EXS08_03255 [Planctomycetes bacterium]|nr:hypothetical protein [Planctomycetota bacterium]